MITVIVYNGIFRLSITILRIIYISTDFNEGENNESC